MGNKMKKLICALLASAMLVSSVGMVAFADEVETTATETTVEATEAPAEETEATEAPAEEAEATEAPVVTEAPVAETGTAYDNDAYYQKALSLCSALGIITGYEDGSVKPESKVTRAEMASIVLRMLNTKSMSVYQNGFTDVTSAHWAADQIQTAQESSIISGMGDGTFAPDGDVTYAQVVVMLVNALNYKQDATYHATSGSHWAAGYMKIAGDLDLLKSAPGNNDVASERGVVIKMVYNALLADYKEIAKYENGTPVYESKETLSAAKFDLIEKKGILWATDKTSVSGGEVQDGHVSILPDEATAAEEYACELKGLEEYLAQTITYYYQENRGLTPEVLAVTYDPSKTDVVDVDIDSIEKIENGQIKLEKVSKLKDCSEATIVYNGKIATDAQITEQGGLDAILLPEKGSLKLVDNDRDNIYDVVFIDSYQTMVITTVGTDKISGKVSVIDETNPDKIGAYKTISINLDDKVDRKVSVMRNGMEVKIRNLKKNDVASIKSSLDNTIVDIVVTGESVTGKVSGVSTKRDNSKATINGEKYEVANIAADDVKSGLEGTFYLDMFGRIAYVEASGVGQLQSGEKYGWLMSGYDSEDGENYIVKIMTTDGKAVEYKVSTTVDYWGPKATTSESLKADEAKTTVQTLLSSDNNFVKASGVNSPIRLVKYKANSNGALTRLYCAVNESSVEDEDALRINPTNLRGVAVSSGLVSGYQINDGIIEFSVPKNSSDMKSADNYKIGEVTSSVYVVRENGANRDYVIGEFTNSLAPTILINFTASSDALASISDIDTAGNNPVMVVHEIDEGVDDDDNEIYTIHGYVGGTEVQVTTSKISVLGEFNATTPMPNKSTYGHTVIWDAKNGGSGAFAGKSLSQILKEGDILLYDGGDKLLRLYDINALYEYIVEGKGKIFTGSVNWSATRNQFRFYPVESVDAGDVAWIDLVGGERLSFDPTKLMDAVEISVGRDAHGATVININEEGFEYSDIEKYDTDTKTGDYVFARICDKGALQEVIVFRFVD